MLTELIKRTVPQFIQSAVHNNVYRYLGLTYRLNSGVKISIGSKTDWLSYNTIFLSGEYDAAIFRLRDHSGSGAVVLDLGCNTGFFALRCLDVLGRGAFEDKFTWMAVDASTSMLALYRQRVLATNGLEGRVKMIHGLVGERAGVAAFFESTNHGANTCVPDHLDTDRKYTKKRIQFVDLDSVVPAGSIALIKCDIEGSEGDFIRNYGDLVRRAESLIFEFHDFCRDQDGLIGRLKEAGFRHQTLKKVPGSSIEFFHRGE